jgi:hypothetical protein
MDQELTRGQPRFAPGDGFVLTVSFFIHAPAVCPALDPFGDFHGAKYPVNTFLLVHTWSLERHYTARHTCAQAGSTLLVVPPYAVARISNAGFPRGVKKHGHLLPPSS